MAKISRDPKPHEARAITAGAAATRRQVLGDSPALPRQNHLLLEPAPVCTEAVEVRSRPEAGAIQPHAVRAGGTFSVEDRADEPPGQVIEADGRAPGRREAEGDGRAVT